MGVQGVTPKGARSQKSHAYELTRNASQLLAAAAPRQLHSQPTQVIPRLGKQSKATLP